jgi:flavin reductase (DIM6/NTAB) family NADH-FMN oxidoreductase RutF
MSDRHRRFLDSDILSWDRYQRAHFMQSLVGPRAVFLVGSINAAGQANAAPFNSVQHLSADPPQISILVRPAGSTPRHTLENIRETKWFTLSSVGPDLIERAHQASAKYPWDENEFESLDIPVFVSDTHDVPYVKASRFCLGLELAEMHRVGACQATLLVGTVREVFVPDSVPSPDGHIPPAEEGPVTVTGLNHYGYVESLKRLRYPASLISP